MQCRINYNENGEIISVDTPTGERSQLFDSLASAVGEDKALDLYALTQTEAFKTLHEMKVNEALQVNKAELLKKLSTPIDKTITIVHNDKPVDVNLSDMKFKVVDTKGYRTYLGVVKIGDEVVQLGKLRLVPYKNSFKSDQSLINNIITIVNGKEADGKGLGIGTQIYKKAISDTIRNNKAFYFSTGRTEGSLGLVNKLKGQGIVTTKNVDGRELDVVEVETPLEPTVEETLSFATSSYIELTKQEEIDIQNSMAGVGITEYAQLLDSIEANLLNNGVIVFTEEALKKSGLYTDYEVNYILGNIVAQESIRRVYQGLKNIDNKYIGETDRFFVVKTDNINALGKQEILNPFVVEQEVAKIIAGKDLDIYLDNIPYDTIKNNYRNVPEFKKHLDFISNNYRNLSEKKINTEGQLVDKTTNGNKEKFEKTLDLDSKSTLNPAIDYISNISNRVWNMSPDSIYKLLKDFNRKAISSGVDFLDLEDRALVKTRQEVLELLDEFQDLLNRPTDANLDSFSKKYSEFFNILEEPVTKTAATKDDTNIYLESTESEQDLFNRYGLIKESANVYKQITPIQDTEEAYNILFSNKDRIPSDIESIEELKEYVNKKINEYNISDFNTPISQVENMVIHKIYFGLPINNEVSVGKQSLIKKASFTGDYQYLTGKFTSDFYKQYLREKKRNTKDFKNFYSEFDVTEKGIVLKSNDSLTVSKVSLYLTEDLKQYNLISKNLDIPVDEIQIPADLEDRDYKREFYISNPDAAPKLKGSYQKISEETIAAKNSLQPFVKTNEGIYEIEHSAGDVTFYTKLPEGDKNFNEWGQHLVKPDSDINVIEYSELETAPSKYVEISNYYNKAELKEINNKYFDC